MLFRSFHDSASLPSGTVGVRAGFALANVDMIDLTVKGLGGHGAYPQLTKDPIVLASAIVMRLQTLVSREAELLQDRVNVPGLPVGHMPFIQRPATTRSRVIYFWSQFNRYGVGSRSYYDAVKDDCRGRSSEYIQRIAYGYTRDTVGKPFPKWGAWNVVKPEHLPKEGTDYFFTDPAGARNWAGLWVRVTPEEKFYIMADWPDMRTFGEWAVPNTEAGGDNLAKIHKAGPAQNSLGLGTVQLRAVWRAVEKEHRLEPFTRYIDPRAGRNPHAEAHGGTCLLDALAQERIKAEARERLTRLRSPVDGTVQQLAVHTERSEEHTSELQSH